MVLANGVFAMSEMAVVSARQARLQYLAERGDSRARAALGLIESPNRFLSTVQIGITLASILAGAFGGATIAEELAGSLSGVPFIGQYGEVLGVAIVVLVTTYLSLVLGELVPKRLALNNAEGIASLIARPMQLLSLLATPAVRILASSTDAVLGVMGARTSREPPVSEEEIGILIEQGIQRGAFEQIELEMVERVFDLDQRRVMSVMTPRTEMQWLDIADTIDSSWRKMIDSGHSCFPVCEGDPDHTLGIVSVKAVWTSMIKGEPPDFRSLVRPVLYVPENVSVLRLLRMFKEAGQQLALVVGEYGGVEGLVTMKDVMGIIVGSLPPSAGLTQGALVVQRPDGSWLVDGLLSLDELQELFALEDDEFSEHRSHYQTLGGFVMAQLGRIPTEADSFEWQDYRFEVVDMDGHRVDKVLMTRLDTAAEGDK